MPPTKGQRGNLYMDYPNKSVNPHPEPCFPKDYSKERFYSGLTGLEVLGVFVYWVLGSVWCFILLVFYLGRFIPIVEAC